MAGGRDGRKGSELRVSRASWGVRAPVGAGLRLHHVVPVLNATKSSTVPCLVSRVMDSTAKTNKQTNPTRTQRQKKAALRLPSNRVAPSTPERAVDGSRVGRAPSQRWPLCCSP